MSDANPPEHPASEDPTPDAPDSTEPTAPLPPFQPAAPTLAATAPPAAPRRTRRTAIIVTVAAVVAALLGGGAFAIYKVFFDGGPQPDEALPDSTIAILTVDLNPSAGQKIEAIKAIRKFPALKQSLGLQTQDDLRKFIFDKAIAGTQCAGTLSYSADVKPWIGKRAAIAAVDLGGKDPVPALALQITDKTKAADHVDDLEKCAGLGEDVGYAVGKDYLIVSDSTAHARTILADGQDRPLAKDPAYQKWTKAAGDQGVVNFYVAKKASGYLAEGMDQLAGSLTDGLGADDPFSAGSGSASGESAPRAASCSDDPFSTLKDQLKGFSGLAGTLRFADGGMELSVVTAGLGQLSSTATVGDEVEDLPADTAVALGFGVPKDYADQLVTSLRCGAGSDAITRAQDATGLTLPGDLQTLLGSALTLSVGGDAPPSLQDLNDPSGLAIGLLVHGDAAKIKALIAKVEETTGRRLSDLDLGVKTSGDKLVVSPSESYAEHLLGNGSLGSRGGFKAAVPDAGRASAILYVDFDSAWRETLIQLGRDAGVGAGSIQEAEDNTKPLKSLGLSSWTDGGTSHLLLKVSTD